MGSSDIVGLFDACLNSFQIVNSVRNFGVHYELLCNELSLLQLRFHFWGASIGIDPRLHNNPWNTCLDQPMVRETIHQTLSNITYLLIAASKIQESYRIPQTINLLSEHCRLDFQEKLTQPHHEPSLPYRPVSPTNHLQKHMSINQKQIPFLKVTKWALVDAKNFEIIIVRLRGYIDALESIYKNVVNFRQPEQESPQLQSPPPYSLIPPIATNIRSRPDEERSVTDIGTNIQAEQWCQAINHREHVYDEVVGRLRSRPAPRTQMRPTIITTTTTTTTTVATRPHEHQEDSAPVIQPPITGSTSVEIFKSFRVSMEDPCYKVLPAALKKYNINAPWTAYALYITYGNEERLIDLNEKPLILFKQLDKQGKRPMFMLRKIKPSPPIPQAPTTKDLITTYVRGYEWKFFNGKGEYRYEIRTYYRHGFEMTIWRTHDDFLQLSNSLRERCDDQRLLVPQLLERQGNQSETTSRDVNALHRYLQVLLHFGDVMRLWKPFRHFFASRDGDEAAV